MVKSRVEPMKGSEFCRAGAMCHLQLHVQRVNASSHSSLMYEVLADQTMWAVCGRTAGKLNMTGAVHLNMQTLSYRVQMSDFYSGLVVLSLNLCHGS